MIFQIVVIFDTRYRKVLGDRCIVHSRGCWPRRSKPAGRGALVYNRFHKEKHVIEALDRITVNPEICMGQPTIRGTRITVSLILKLVANGMTAKQIGQAYPEIEEEDVSQSLMYAAWLSSEKVRDFPSRGTSVA